MSNNSNKTRTAGLGIASAVAIAAGASCTQPVPTPQGNFIDSWCETITSGPSGNGTINRYRGMHAQVFINAENEGYQWGGGCWNDNNLDDSPNQPTRRESTKGEGPDCSGLVMKAWSLNPAADGSWATWSQWEYMPTSHRNFYTGRMATNTDSWKSIPKADAEFWDAFNNAGSHTGLVYQTLADGTDYIFEAKGEAYGTGTWVRDYRTSPSYEAAVRRIGWEG